MCFRRLLCALIEFEPAQFSSWESSRTFSRLARNCHALSSTLVRSHWIWTVPFSSWESSRVFSRFALAGDSWRKLSCNSHSFNSRRLSFSFGLNVSAGLAPWGAGRRRGTPLYKLYSHVPPQRVWFLSSFCLKMGIYFEHFGLKLGMFIFTCLSEIEYRFLSFWLEKGGIFKGQVWNWVGKSHILVWKWGPTTYFEEYPLPLPGRFRQYDDCLRHDSALYLHAHGFVTANRKQVVGYI